MKNINIKRGGKRPGSGRPKRKNVKTTLVMIEKESFEFFKTYGGGYFGRGIDKAADFLKRLGKVVAK